MWTQGPNHNAGALTLCCFSLKKKKKWNMHLGLHSKKVEKHILYSETLSK